MKTIEEVVRELNERIKECEVVLKFCGEFHDSKDIYTIKRNAYHDILDFIEVS